MAEPESTQPAEPARSDDELFAELVAGFDDPVAESERAWPEAENLSDPKGLNNKRPGLSGFGDLTPEARPRPVIQPLPMVNAVPPVDPRAWTAAEDPDEDHYVPPEPPPLPPAEAPTKMALLALAVGVVLGLLGGFDQLPPMATFLGVALSAGGIVTLVVRMKDPDEDERDDDPHNGAVV